MKVKRENVLKLVRVANSLVSQTLHGLLLRRLSLTYTLHLTPKLFMPSLSMAVLGYVRDVINEEENGQHGASFSSSLRRRLVRIGLCMILNEQGQVVSFEEVTLLLSRRYATKNRSWAFSS